MQPRKAHSLQGILTRHPLAVTLMLAGLLLIATAMGASAQELSINLGADGNKASGLTENVLQMVALITVLSLAPGILIMTTSFVRIVIVLSLLRTAMGMQQSPPNMVLISLALFLTGFVMAPVFSQAYDTGIKPLMNDEIEMDTAFELTAQPFRKFMLSQVRPKDLAIFEKMAEEDLPETPDATPLHVLIPAFMISELRTAFEIGFLVFIPFLVIDLVIASVLMSMGMMMLPPIIISLPFKIIFFVLVDGWGMIAGSLVASFQN